MHRALTQTCELQVFLPTLWTAFFTADWSSPGSNELEYCSHFQCLSLTQCLRVKVLSDLVSALCFVDHASSYIIIGWKRGREVLLATFTKTLIHNTVFMM